MALRACEQRIRERLLLDLLSDGDSAHRTTRRTFRLSSLSLDQGAGVIGPCSVEGHLVGVIAGTASRNNAGSGKDPRRITGQQVIFII